MLYLYRKAGTNIYSNIDENTTVTDGACVHATSEFKFYS